MILAGIDEAGYGPILGPLVVGCCAFDVNHDAPDLPCLWSRLRRSVSKSRDKKGLRIHINDSKQVYCPSAGLKELERSVLALVAATGSCPATLDDLIARLADHARSDLATHPWYVATPHEKFPLEQDGTSIRLLAKGLRDEMERSATRCVHLAARILPERHLNDQFKKTRNKSSVLFSASAVHLDGLIRSFGQMGLTVFCDRQGGREHYGHLLRLMFDEWSLEVVQEVEGLSEYALVQGRHRVRLIFREKAESRCMSVAVASMIAKYLREALMHRFNAWWQGLVPNLAPTAGYYTDGLRFLRDIDGKRRELGLHDADLVRSR